MTGIVTGQWSATVRRRGPLLLFLVWLALAVYAVSAPVVVWAQRATLVTLVSGSMSPTYPTGALLLVRKVDADRGIKVSDVVTVARASGMPVTHRVVEIVIVDGRPAYRTKGDANSTPDAQLAVPGSVVGRVQGQLPRWLIGSVWLHGKWQRLLLFGIPLVSALALETLHFATHNRRR